jgi:hypothetical protein
VAPVLAPVIVSFTIIGCGLAALYRPMKIRPIQWAGLVLGGALVVLSFTWDFQRIVTGHLPRPFAWWLFVAGEAVSLGTFLKVFLSRRLGQLT